MPKPHPYIGQTQTGGNQDQGYYNDQQARAMMEAYSSTADRLNVPSQSPNDPIAVLLKDLATKTGAIQFGDQKEPRFMPVPAASIVNLAFNDAVPSPVVSANTLANMMFESDALRAAIYKASAYLQAGVQLCVVQDPNSQTTQELIQAQHTFVSAEPINFEFIAGESITETAVAGVDGITGAPVTLNNETKNVISAPAGELTTQAAPFAYQSFKIADDASVGATFTISRRTLKNTPQFTLNGLMYDAIAGGLAKAIDKAMSTHLGGLTLAPFTLAAAAARGLHLSDLRGITSGSSTDAALVEGQLFLKGVPAELCAATGSYVFAPAKFAVAVPQDLRVTAKRLNNGAVEFTIWTNIEVLATTQSNTAVWSA